MGPNQIIGWAFAAFIVVLVIWAVVRIIDSGDAEAFHALLNN